MKKYILTTVLFTIIYTFIGYVGIDCIDRYYREVERHAWLYKRTGLQLDTCNVDLYTGLALFIGSIVLYGIIMAYIVEYFKRED